MTPDATAGPAPAEGLQDAPPPACVMSFNAADPSGAGGLAGDVATLAAMGAHALPVTTCVLMRDSAEIFDQHPIDADVVAEQARTVLEDITVSGWKVGFLGSAEAIGAVAEILSDYPELPLVSYLPNLGWLDDDVSQPYLEAFRELILPATEVLVGNHKTLTDFLLPEWDSERPPSARELAVAAGEHGTRFVLVTGIMLTSSSTTCWPRRKARSPARSSRCSTPPSSVPATPCRPRWPPCWPPVASCMPPWVKPSPSWIRRSIRASAPAWAV